MSHSKIRYFSLGLITAASILSLVYFLEPAPAETERKEAITEAEVNAYLDKQGFVKVEEQKYAELLKKEKEAVKQQEEQVDKPKDKGASTTSEDKKEEQAQPEQPKTYSLSITPGMSSDAVSTTLEEQKLIESAQDFNNYLSNKNKQGSLRVGTYKITSDMSYKQIVQIITKSN